MTFIDQLKRIYDRELPRPHHLILHARRYDEAMRALAPPATVQHTPSLLDLSIYVGEIPANEIHFVNRAGHVYKVEKIA